MWRNDIHFTANRKRRTLEDRAKEADKAVEKGYTVPAWLKYWSEQRKRDDGYAPEMVNCRLDVEAALAYIYKRRL